MLESTDVKHLYFSTASQCRVQVQALLLNCCYSLQMCTLGPPPLLLSLLSLSSMLALIVCSWLVYTDPGFGGLVGVLEVGEYPCPESWGFPDPFVGSLRPLRMVK